MISFGMKHPLSKSALMCLTLLAAAQTASAEPQQAQHEIVDARLEGYDRNVTLGSGTALTWMLLVFLAGVCVIGLFKDAKRSHLD